MKIQYDKQKDKKHFNQYTKNEEEHQSKLERQKVWLMLVKQGRTITSIAKEAGVSVTCVHKSVNNERARATGKK